MPRQCFVAEQVYKEVREDQHPVVILSGVDLNLAELTAALLYVANLTGASLTGADLRGARTLWTDGNPVPHPPKCP